MRKTRRISVIGLCFVLLLTLLSCQPSLPFEESTGTNQKAQSSASNQQDSNIQPNATEEHVYQPLKVMFLDVGQGDSILIINGSESMLIDGGPPEQSKAVLTHLENEGISRLAYIVATHAHADHIGGLTDVVESLQVDSIYMPKIPHSTRTFESFLDAVAAKDMTIAAPVCGQTFPLGDAEVSILAPISAYPDNLNNSSIVLRIDHGNHSFLFTGDAETESERAMIAVAAPLASDVLKVAHHGSSTSCTTEFIDAVSPTWAVISVGSDNSYGHPADSTVRTLIGHDAKIYRTDLDGTIVFYCDGYDISVETLPWKTVSQSAEAEHTESVYIGNITSKIFHLPTCGSLPAPKNQVLFRFRDEALESGYRACKKCNP